MLKTYGYRRYECGCLMSLSKAGERQGFAEQCLVSQHLMTAQIVDPRGTSKDVSAEWREIWNIHLKEVKSDVSL